MTVETEVPCLVRDLEVQAVKELWSDALSCHVAVTFRDSAVTVKVFKLILHRTTVSVIFLTIGIVRVWGVTYHLAAEIATRTLGDASRLDVIVPVLCRIELREAGILECAVEAQLHAPFIRPDRYSAGL